MAVKGEAADLVASGGCGLVCPPEDPRALATTIIQLKNISAAERERMGQSGLALFRARFEKTILLSKLEKLILGTAAMAKGKNESSIYSPT